MESEVAADAFAQNELSLAVAPCLTPAELQAIVAICRHWRRGVVTHVESVHGLCRWLGSQFTAKLEADAFELCKQSANTSWNSQDRFTLALLVEAQPEEEALQRGLSRLDELPFVNLPPMHLRRLQVTSGCTEGWQSKSSCAADGAAYQDITRALRRQWASAYINPDGEDLDHEAQRLCNDVLSRWRGLWAVARCGNMCAQMDVKILRRESLRGTELWQISVLQLQIDDQSTASGAFAAVCLDYWERRIIG